MPITKIDNYELIKLFNSGASINECAEYFGVTRKTMILKLQKLGIYKTTHDINKIVVAQFLGGRTIEQIHQRHQIPIPTIIEVLKANKLMRTGKKTEQTKYIEQLILRDYSLSSIAEKYGLTRQRVWLIKQNMEKEKQQKIE